MNPPKKLSSQQQSESREHTLGEQQKTQQPALEFANAEQMLRHDALHTPVPPAIAHRLRESIRDLPVPPRSWWRRFFGS